MDQAILNGDVHCLETKETSKPRMLVLNHDTKQAWVNVTLKCNTCPACEKRRALARSKGRELFGLSDELTGYLWTEVEYPSDGLLGNVSKIDVFYTPVDVEVRPLGILRDAYHDENGIVMFR